MIIETELGAVLRSLTAKQRELLDLLGEGLTSKEIARKLGVSPSAIDQRMKTLKERFGVTSKNELARRCRQVGMAALSAADQASIIEGLSRSREIQTGGNSEEAIAEASAGPALSQVGPVPYDPVAQSRFLFGFVLGFLSGGVVAGASFTYALRTVLAVV